MVPIKQNLIKCIKFVTLVALMCFLLFCGFACIGQEKQHNIPEYCVVTYLSSDGGTVSGEIIQTIEIGQSCSEVVAVPNEEYMFDSWSDGVQTVNRQDREVLETFTVKAQFIKKEYSVLYTTSEGGKISGERRQTVQSGEYSIPVEAVALPGYVFEGWSDGCDTVTRNDCIRQDTTFTAKFRQIYALGDGTSKNPYCIENYQGLLDMKYFPSSCFNLVCDLDLTGYEHKPIFDISSPFCGSFNGNCYMIRNLNIDFHTNIASLLGIIANGKVCNLQIVDFMIRVADYNTQGQASSIGALASESLGVIENVYVQGTISGNDLHYDGIAIGGIVGQAFGTIKNSSADVVIQLKNITRSGTMLYPFNVGGLIGVGQVNMYSCHAQTEISAYNAHTEVRLGGLIGYYIQMIRAFNAIQDTDCSVKIYGNSVLYSAGAIAQLVSLEGQVAIENCKVNGSIAMQNAGFVGGFICNVLGYETEIKISNTNSCMENINAQMGSGFIYSLLMQDNGKIEIHTCFSESNFKVHMGAGFIFLAKLSDARIYRSYAISNINAFAAYGFICQAMGGNIEECFAEGTLHASFIGAGFIGMFSSTGFLKNCYATSYISITNVDETDAHRTLAGGFLISARGVKIDRCYYAGKITGTVYTPKDPPSYSPPIVSDFICMVAETQITNCYLLYNKNTFALGIIGSSSDIDDVGLLLFYENDGSDISSFLNNGLDEEVWKSGTDGLPVLAFYEKGKI